MSKAEIQKRIEVNERIEAIYQQTVWQSEGVLIEVVEREMSDALIAHAARFWVDARARFEASQGWRAKIRPSDLESAADD